MQEPNTPLLRPVVGLTRGMAPSDIEKLTISAIKTHRKLVEEADLLFQACHTEDGRPISGTDHPAHLAYVSAMIDMHAQMSALSTLLDVLGYIPIVPAEPSAKTLN